jgi:hypothetical protein
MWVRWSVDGITIVCDREECMVGGKRWSAKVTGRETLLQPEHLTDAMARHVYEMHRV